jgi:hypothetical protein
VIARLAFQRFARAQFRKSGAIEGRIVSKRSALLPTSPRRALLHFSSVNRSISSPRYSDIAHSPIDGSISS